MSYAAHFITDVLTVSQHRFGARKQFLGRLRDEH
jgi:hypothetical protein